MNKKVLTLCAGFLLAGSLATLDAKITKVTTPKIGDSVLMGTAITANTSNSKMTDLITGLNGITTTSADVTVFGAEWTLVQAKDADGADIANQFYLRNVDGKYLADGGDPDVADSYQAKLVDKEEDAAIFKLERNAIKIVDGKGETWQDIYYLGVSGGVLRAVGSNTQAIDSYATISAVSAFNNNDLIESIGGDYYFVGTNTATAVDQVLKYDKDNGTVSLESYPTGLNPYGDAYDAYLWKVSATTANNIITYTFESKIDGAKFTFTTDYAYANGFNLTGAPFAANQIVALYKSPVIYKTAAELNAILTNGFEMTIKKNKDDNSVISGIDAFSGKLTAIPNNNNTRFQIINEDEEYLVLNTKADWGTGNVGVNDRGHKFEWVDVEKLAENAADYRTWFEFTYNAGAADEKIVNNVAVYAAATGGTAYGNLFIQTGTTGTETTNWLTTSNGIASTGEAWPYIILQSDNIVKINEVNERFLTFTYADTKVNAGNAVPEEVYKYGGMLVTYRGTDRYISGGTTWLQDAADYVDATTIYEKAPEAQWAVTDYNEANGTFTLTNRESQEKIYNVLLRWEDKAKGICTVISDNDNFTNDLVKMTVVTDPTMFDGFAKYNESELRNNKFYLGQHHGIAGNSTAYFVENHGNSHQIGVTAEEDAASKWNLRFATRQVEVDGKDLAVVDTMFVTTEFYTLKSDGTQETDAKKVNKSKLAILPYTFQNAGNREYVNYQEANNLEYYYCDETNKDEPQNASRFALKMKADSTYNFVLIGNGWEGDKLESEDQDYFISQKVYVANSTDRGSLKQMYAYDEDNNSLMVVEKIESPEYHLITNHAWGDTIRLFRGDNDSQVLYEKKDAKSVVSNDTLSFLNVDNTNQFDVNPSMFADTAYVNRWDADGIKNTCYQYLLAVQPEFGYHVDNCNNPAHKPDVTNQIDTVYGRFLINLIDTANMYGINNIHNNPYIIESESGDYLAKLAFVNGFHTNDTLYIPRENADTVKLAMDTPDFNVAKFAFRYVDDQAKTFKIQTQYKEYLGGMTYATEEDVAEIYEENPSYITNEGYLRWVNGTIAVVRNWEAGDVFSIEEGVEATPTANEEISANAAVSVVATDGAVIVKGAEGKNVIVSTILGKVVANEVLNSDNETIAAPAGIVVVDGESFKVAVK